MKSLTTKRYRLIIPSEVPVEQAIQDLFRIRSNQEIAEVEGIKPFTTHEESKKLLQRLLRNTQENQSEFWFIYDQQNRCVGVINLWDFDPARTEAEFGYSVLPDFQRQGVMSEALVAAKHYAFEELGLAQLNIYTGATNIPLQGLIKKNHYQQIRQLTEPNGKGEQTVMIQFAKTRAAYYRDNNF